MSTRPAIDHVVDVLRLEIGGADHLPQGIALRVKLADPLANESSDERGLGRPFWHRDPLEAGVEVLVDHYVQALYEPLHQCQEMTQSKRRAERDRAADQLDLAISRQAPGGPRAHIASGRSRR
jgi:hypothetical protein